MGPRLVSRGKCLLLNGDIADFYASMGPRLVSRGKHRIATPFRLEETGAKTASMGPRLVSRGKRAAAAMAATAKHGFNGAATC